MAQVVVYGWPCVASRVAIHFIPVVLTRWFEGWKSVRSYVRSY